MAKASKTTYLTPIAEAMWPFIAKANTRWKEQGEYSVTLVLDPGNTDHKDFLALLKQHVTEAEQSHLRKKANNMPWKRHTDEDGRETGKFTVTFKTGGKYPPAAFDKLGNRYRRDDPKDVEKLAKIGNGTTCRVAYKWAHYEAFGGGIALYFQAIQLIDVVEYEGNFGFEPVGGEREPGSDDQPFSEEIPF